MIEILERGSGKVFGMKVSGKILHRDYQQFVPMLEKLIEEHGSVRCLVEMIDFHGIELPPCGTRSSSTCGMPGRSSAAPSSATVPGRHG